MILSDGLRLVDPQETISRIHAADKQWKSKGRSKSIPSNYQTVVVHNDEKNAFWTSTKRFEDTTQNENPGPGKYNYDWSAPSDNPSLSKRGTGFFASKSKRTMNNLDGNSNSARTFYTLPTFPAKTDFNKSKVSRVFQKPIAQSPTEPKETKNDSSPGPKYDIRNVRMGAAKARYNVPAAQASFKSTTSRIQLSLLQKKAPGPAEYDIQTELIFRSSNPNTSTFRSRSDRFPSFNTIAPGPGQYNPKFDQDSKAMVNGFRPHHYLSFSAPAMAMPKDPEPPGPGHYDLRDFEGPPKHFMSSAAFVSNTGRWVASAQRAGVPGPSDYHPNHSKRQSYHYNAYGGWVP